MRQRSQRSGIETALLYATRAAILLVLAMPLMVRIELFFPFVVGKALYFRVLTEIAFGLWVVLAYRFSTYRPSRFVILAIFAAYLVVALLAGVFGVSFQRSMWSTYERMQGIVDIAHWLLFVLVASSVFRSFAEWRTLLNVNLGVSLLISLMGIVQYYELFEVPGYGFLETTRRLDVTLGNATYVGAYMLMSILVALGLLAQSYRDSQETATASAAVRRRRRRRDRQRGGSAGLFWVRAFWLSTVFFGLWVFVLSGARGAVIGLVMSLATLALVYAVWESSRRVRMAALAALLVVVSGSILFAAAKDTPLFDRAAESVHMMARLRNIGLDDTSIRPRVLSWKAGLRGYAEKPVLGWGPENYVVVWGRYLELGAGPTDIHDQAHSKPIEELATKGTLGFIAYFAIWGSMLWVIYRRVRSRDHPEQRFILFVTAALAGYFVQNLFLFDTLTTVLSFMVLLAYIVRLEQQDEAPAATPARRGRGVAGERLDRGWYAAIGIALVAVAASILLMNVPPYRAAKTVAQATRPNVTWDGRMALYEEAIGKFPPLANQPRLRLLGLIYSNWDKLSEGQQLEALEIAKRQSDLILENEPQDWMTYLNLVNIHQRASSLDRSHLERSAEYLETATLLAPGPIETSGLVQRQKEIEARYELQTTP